jgi:predicted nucleotidyltransferase component of viral defense system
MYNIAKLSNNDRDIVFTKYAFENSVSKAIVEKDFWVTLILDYLFHRCKYKDYFIFKGGTSLSKCFNIIERFSEDIDLILRWDLLTDDNPNKERSNRQQDIYNKNINKLAADFIKEKLMPEMIYDFNNLLGQKAEFQIDENEQQVLNFNYPRLYNDDAGILKFVRLEIGPLAALTPTEDVTISPLISKLNLKLMNKNETIIKTVSPERTFWEKILILNQESHRPLDKKMPTRYSRHYYDVYKISLTKYKDKAYSNLELLEQVREFKKKFYPVGWAKYDLAKPGLFTLVPSEERIKELRVDFSNMKEMINDNLINSFDDLLFYIKQIEREINNLK